MAADWRTVWIVGGSSGIGYQLAKDLAARGSIVAVSARSAEKLAAMANADHRLQAYALDTTDVSAVTDAVAAIRDAHGPIDLVVCAAAVWHPMVAGVFDAAAANEALLVNVGGVNNVLAAVLPDMIGRNRGHVAVVASVAGYRGLPRAAAYGPTKAALINLAETLRLDLRRHGIDVSVINPGFVDTPMTARNDFPMPFMVGVEEASSAILKGLERRRFEIAFPWRFVAMLKIARLLPYRLYFWSVRNFMKA
ncbi:MAG: SDR family NAD(P)-dependent oxidoreductase [Hyphomicrobiaceae bacterium]